MPSSRARAAGPEWQPFRLTVRMATPVSLTHPWLHLDSIVRHLIDERTYGRDADLGGWDDERRGDRMAAMRRAGTAKFVQALARCRIADEWISCASVSEVVPADLGYETIRSFKRFEADRFPGRGKVTLSNGHYRTWLLQTVYVPAESVTFHGVGLLGHLTDLLGDLTHLGNDTRIGWGLVDHWSIEPSREDWSLARDGIATRPLPVRLLAEWDDEAWLTWHAPYWDRRRAERCAPPGARVRLRP